MPPAARQIGPPRATHRSDDPKGPAPIEATGALSPWMCAYTDSRPDLPTGPRCSAVRRARVRRRRRRERSVVRALALARISVLAVRLDETLDKSARDADIGA